MFGQSVFKAASCLALCATLVSCSASVNGGDPFNFPVNPTPVTPENGQLKIAKEAGSPGFEDFNDISSETGITTNISKDFAFKVAEETTLQPQISGIATETSAACDKFDGDVKFTVTDKSGGLPVVIATSNAGYATFTALAGKDYVLNVSVANPTGCRVWGMSFLMKTVARN